MPLIQRFGGKIRQLREEANITQLALAQQIGMKSKGYISDIESGKKIPPAETILRIADLFHVTIDSLLRDDIELERR